MKTKLLFILISISTFSTVFSQDYRIEEMNGETYVIKNNKIVYTIDFGNGQAYGTITDQNNNTLFKVESSANGYTLIDNVDPNYMWTFENNDGRSFMRDSNSLGLFERIIGPGGDESMIIGPDGNIVSTSTSGPDGSMYVTINDNQSSVQNALDLLEQNTNTQINTNIDYSGDIQLMDNMSLPVDIPEPVSSGPNYDLIAGAKELADAQSSYANAASDGFAQGFTEAYNNALALQSYSRSLYANAKFKGTPSYNPKSRKPFRKLKVEKFKNIISINISQSSNIEDDPMYLNSKLFKAFSLQGMVSDKSPNRLIFSYRYRPDTGCGGIVINELELGIFDMNNNQIASATFRQGSFEGKCIDDVIYQMVQKLNN